MDYGLQLYSVRDVTDTDLEGTLKKVAEIGYRYVEFAGFFGHNWTSTRTGTTTGTQGNESHIGTV